MLFLSWERFKAYKLGHIGLRRPTCTWTWHKMAFDIQFWIQCCSVKHDWMNFNYISFESILIILHEINMIIVTHPTTFVHCFRVLFFSSSGTHCKAVSKQLCVYHLYRSVFLPQTRIGSHLGCRNWFQYPQSNRDSKRVSKRLSRVVAFIIDFSVSRVRGMPGMLSLRSCIAKFHPKHNAFKGVSK